MYVASLAIPLFQEGRETLEIVARVLYQLRQFAWHIYKILIQVVVVDLSELDLFIHAAQISMAISKVWP